MPAGVWDGLHIGVCASVLLLLPKMRCSGQFASPGKGLKDIWNEVAPAKLPQLNKPREAPPPDTQMH